MRLAFAGAHRSGKSTLAAIFAERYCLTFIESQAGVVAKEIGFDMSVPHSLDERLAYQHLVLNRFLDQMEECGDNFVCDRTPIDMAAYMLADIGPSSGYPEEQEAAVCYMDTCIKLTARMFDAIVAVPPVIPVEPAPGKPPVNPAYQWHHHVLVTGMLADSDYPIKWVSLPLDCLSVEDRVNSIHEYLRNTHYDPAFTELAA